MSIWGFFLHIIIFPINRTGFYWIKKSRYKKVAVQLLVQSRITVTIISWPNGPERIEKETYSNFIEIYVLSEYISNLEYFMCICMYVSFWAFCSIPLVCFSLHQNHTLNYHSFIIRWYLLGEKSPCFVFRECLGFS